MSHIPDDHRLRRPPIDDAAVEPYGDVEVVNLVRSALCAYTDNCQRCFRQQVGVIARNPQAMVTLLRIMCAEIGRPLKPVRGSDDEVKELGVIAQAPVATRRESIDALIISMVDTAHLRCGPECQGHGESVTTG